MTDKPSTNLNASGNGHASYRLTVMVPKRRYWSCLKERWWVPLVGLVLALGTVLVYETIRSESYTSFAQLYATGEAQLNVGSLFSEESQNYFGTQIELLKSGRLQNAAFKRTGYVAKPGANTPVTLNVAQPMRTSILVLQATGSDADLTQRFLDSLIQEYLAYKKETRISTSEDIVVSLTEQLARQEKELQTEQEKWAGFQKTNNVAVLEEEAKSAGLYLAELNLHLAKLRLERDLLENGIGPVASASGTNAGPAATHATGGGRDAAMRSALVDLGVLKGEKETKMATLSEMHPQIRRLNEEIARLEKTVAILRDHDREERQNDLEETEQRIAAIAAALPTWETKVLQINERLSDSHRLKNNVDRKQRYYEHLLGTLQNADLSRNVQQERLSILQPATPSQPADRNLPLRVVLAFVAGLALSLGVVFGWYLLDDRLVSVQDIKDQFSEKVIGLVPQIRGLRSKPARDFSPSTELQRGYAESFRHLRSAVLLSSLNGQRPQTLLFTGIASGEGKTTVATNLARTLARSGFSVALVDCEGHGHEQFFDSKEQPGLFDYLRGNHPASDILHPTEVPGLSFVPAGREADFADGLFLPARLSELMQELQASRDFIILDGAPILSQDHVAQLVPFADVVILVARPFFTRSRLMHQALDMLYQRRAKQIAIVLNRARRDDLAGYYAEHGLARAGKNGASSPA
ncbi:MAG: AAA family ATPase [Akkermansiaceae bacterium]|nr:AAA family ATPase [Verrucomicrobiales bacterium]